MKQNKKTGLILIFCILGLIFSFAAKVFSGMSGIDYEILRYVFLGLALLMVLFIIYFVFRFYKRESK